MDAVVNALAGEFTDASLALSPRGGRFVAMGRTDIRDVAQVAESHPGVVYRGWCSSAAAAMSGADQGSCPAANTFLDAPAGCRRDRCLVGRSQAWGLRDQASGMTGHLEGAGLSRLRRGGVHPLTTEQGPVLSEALPWWVRRWWFRLVRTWRH
ncbi:hypothetical protein [Streptomyces rapamycinicus]|nr:hypothetical protein LJB45_35090 [Streptomyces rapamycinicus]